MSSKQALDRTSVAQNSSKKICSFLRGKLCTSGDCSEPFRWTVLFIIFHDFQRQIFFCHGRGENDRKFLWDLWGSSSLLFEPVVSRGLNLERHLIRGEGSISLRGSWWVVERPRSYLSPAGRFCEQNKFTERVLRTTWGGRWSAIDVLCEALFGKLFHDFERRSPCAKTRPGTFRILSEAFRDLPDPSWDFF